MKNIILISLSILFMSFTAWQPDFKTAKRTAKDKDELILLSFSGSDWCVPCIRMKKEFFADSSFLQMADTTLVMYNANFPRLKKNMPDKKIIKDNEELADKYNPDGKFPFTLILDTDGHVLKSWDGLPEENVKAFIQEVKKISDAHHVAKN